MEVRRVKLAEEVRRRAGQRLDGSAPLVLIFTAMP